MSGPFDSVPIKKPIHCPNATKLGFAKYAVETGDVIFSTNGAESVPARVLGCAVRDGFDNAYKYGTVLLVLQLGENMTHAHVRHVKIEDVVEIRFPDDYRTFINWFFTSQLPSAAAVVAAAEYGALGNRYLSKYLDENGNLPEGWKPK